MFSFVPFAVIVALTLFGGMQHYRASRNPMIETMFHDGQPNHTLIADQLAFNYLPGLLYYIYLLSGCIWETIHACV